MVVDNQLKFDTIVADRRIWYVWPNAYRVYLIRRAAKLHHAATIRSSRFRERRKRAAQRLARRAHHRHAGEREGHENGEAARVRLVREDDYRATYAPLISLVSEKCTNDDSIDLALGRPMDEYRFVIALTFEQLNKRRARHLRAMVMWEEALLDLPDEMPRVDFEEHKTRYRTLQAIARQYRAHPERFGIVKVWRPKIVRTADLASMVPSAALAARR